MHSETWPWESIETLTYERSDIETKALAVFSDAKMFSWMVFLTNMKHAALALGKNHATRYLASASAFVHSVMCEITTTLPSRWLFQRKESTVSESSPFVNTICSLIQLRIKFWSPLPIVSNSGPSECFFAQHQQETNLCHHCLPTLRIEHTNKNLPDTCVHYLCRTSCQLTIFHPFPYKQQTGNARQKQIEACSCGQIDLSFAGSILSNLASKTHFLGTSLLFMVWVPVGSGR